MKQKTGIVIFNEENKTVLVKTPKGVFENVPSIGGFDNYREMDSYVGNSCEEECKKTGLLAYLFGSDERMFTFYYPGGGDITVYAELK